MEKTPYSGQGQCLGMTVSIGVAVYNHDLSNLDAMLRMADQAMYQAKNLGRNRVIYLDGHS